MLFFFLPPPSVAALTDDNDSGAQRGSTNRPKLLRHVSREDFSIPSFVQLRRQAYLSRSTPHSHALGGADTGEALLPPVLVSTLKDALADLSLVGGGSLDETIRRILQAVLKDEVASELYWAGHGSKQSFQQANLQEVIFRASGNRYSGEAAFADVGPHQHQLQLQHQQCMLVKAF
ncbi:hypothetical protein AOXY_G27082 [Acipenser oxyrinchus oxyrinchus]|uniref:DUF4806 domain-containing protein n=1 Tax=Acipenser oxyrinchus oxyrinchus TaxID=40147 RepID=A0AAD8CTX1_ACIOX|nr:hypothetical protein AOXY_G27082 [Acipenser oxyrinchus oxyrinchus]